ncbi:MAG: hypothetical protein HETSPECPRED_000447 [Heterodermia speciosa]|uniref:Amino acid permease/ SLC12A domain-containing protein n=1 Tax=Heterodermia speciosa TaxID=116794 RepID=A0A8H3IDA9_9LECA|nr:MAG: hypothetical protein HETSPECPRED_000447 [Heterodermia speciosa]
MADQEPKLRQELYGWQIFMITISAVIGVTIFYIDGEALEVAGPGGTLMAFVIIGIVAICVNEGISEMIQCFPAPNALMEYVKAFVDPDLAWVVGIMYWYTYAAIFAIQIIAAASFSAYWNLAQVYQTVAFYGLAPVVILFINFAGVWYFGWIETVGGFLKICMVVGSGIFMYVVHSQDGVGSEYINDGFKNDADLASNHKIAAVYVIPMIAYGFLAIEMIAITAFEARDIRSLRRPSQIMAYFVIGIYLFCVIGELLNVSWTNQALPDIYGGSSKDIVTTNHVHFRSRAIIIIAAIRGGYTHMPGFLNGCLIFAALSAANTSLYIASRALYGMTRAINPWKWFGWLKLLGTVWHKSGVPMWALVASALSFGWLPFLQLKGGYAIADLLEIMSISASVSCLLVWASQCLAYIRYHAWLKKHRTELATAYPEYNRWASTWQASTFLAGLQPLPAWIGLITCLVIVFPFTTATWWSTEPTFTKIAVAYGSPIVSLAFFLILKLITRRWYVELDNDSAVLFAALERLRYVKPMRRPASESKRRLFRFWNRKSERAYPDADRNGVLNAAPINQDIELAQRQGERI